MLQTLRRKLLANLTEHKPLMIPGHSSSSADGTVAPSGVKTLKVKRSFIHPCSDLSARLPCIHWLSV